jgi:hypothetical protein
MESVEEAISTLRLKIEETKKIRRRQETELLELTIVLADINKKASEAKRVCFERIQAAEQQKTKQRLVHYLCRCTLSSNKYKGKENWP